LRSTQIQRLSPGASGFSIQSLVITIGIRIHLVTQRSRCTAPSPGLLKALAEYRLTNVTSLSGGFRASTPDGQPAASPNDA